MGLDSRGDRRHRIVVSLGLLVRETRENTNAIQSQTYPSLTAELNDLRTGLYDSSMTGPYLTYLNQGVDALSEVDHFKIIISTEAKWGITENAFYARERDILGVEEWLRFESAICRNFQLDKQLWDSDELLAIRKNIGYHITDSITPLFREFVEAQCVFEG